MKQSIFLAFSCAVIYFGVNFYILYHSKDVPAQVFNENSWVNPLNDVGITENQEIYKDDLQSRADEIYITILKTSKKDTPVEVYFKDGGKTALDNAIFIREANATLELKGKSPEKDIQKSYKIRLFDKEGLWHNQNIINLNKHYDDPLRIRNKLSFDYFTIIPDITSFRTRFVRLYINDLSNEASKGTFEDYGLYTQTEHPNKLFLQNHILDSNAHLYEAEKFNFSRYPQILKNKEDSTYSKNEFEKLLTIRGNDDHQKLIDMLEAVNNANINIDEVIETHFAKENYLTWLAVNILFDNCKAGDSNFILYSPINTTKWYFMPWDFDEAWGLEKDRPKWQKGISIYWDNVLHRRFLEKPENVAALNKKIDEISKIAHKDQTRAFLDSYYNILMTNITILPDLRYLPVTLDNYKKEYLDLPLMVERNRLYYYELLETPMPFHLRESEHTGSKHRFSWDESFDLQGDSISYTFEIGSDKKLSSVVMTQKDLNDTNTIVDNLEPGVYYWRVTARDAKGNWQTAFNVYRDEFGDKYFGIKKVIIQ